MSFLQRASRYGNWYLERRKDDSDKFHLMRGQALVFILHCNPILISCGFILAHDASLLLLLSLGPLISALGLWALRRTENVDLVAGTHVVAMQLLASAIAINSQTFVSFHYVLVPYNVIISSLIVGSSKALGIALGCLIMVLSVLFYNLSIGTHLPYGMCMFEFALGSFATIIIASILVAYLTAQFEKLREQKELTAIQNQNSLNQSLNLVCLGNLVGNINHEFNNALGIIRASLEFYERFERQNGESEKKKRSLQLVDNGLERVNFILDGLRLSVAFDEVLEADNFPVSTIVSKIQIYTEPFLKQYKQELVFKDFTANATIVFPSHILLKVLEILIINACEAGPREGMITILIKRGSESMDFEVMDSGSGIKPDIAPHIFEPFFSTKVSGVGKGLGLSIAKRLMESQGGRLQHGVDREATTFVASVPLGSA